MKKVCLAFVLASVALAACSKKADPTPTPLGATVTSASPGTTAPAAADTGGGGGGGTSTASFPATEAGAKQLLDQFVKSGADHAALSKGLRPTSADYKALYDAETASKLESAYAKEWDAGRLVVAPKPGQTEVKLWAASADDLKAGKGNAREFPGGYKRVAPHLNAGVTIYRFKFVEPGKDLGMAFDGLSNVNGHWVLVPKPWRAVGKGED